MRIYIDTETGGTDHHRHPVIQMAALAVDPAGQIVEEFERKLRFREELCEPEALELNNYSPGAWQSAVKPIQAVLELAGFLERYRSIDVPKKSGEGTWQAAYVAGWNVAFDVDFVMATANSPGWQWTTEARYIRRERGAVFLPWRLPAMDILQRFAWWAELAGVRVPNLRLETICAHLAMGLPDAHDALADAKATAAIDQTIRLDAGKRW